MTDFHDRDLTGASFSTVRPARATSRDVDFFRAGPRGVWMSDVTIDGELRNPVINGVGVAPLTETERDLAVPETRGRPAAGS